MRAEIFTVCGFLAWFFKCFNSNHLRSHLGVCQRRVLIFVRFAEGFIGQRGFREGFYRCRGVFEGKNDLQQRGKGWSRFTKVARCHYCPFLRTARLLCLGEGIYITFRVLYTLVLVLLGIGVKIRGLNNRIRS